MAKSSKSNDRRARVEQLERERKAAERKRTLVFVGVIGAVAAIIIGATGWSLLQDRAREQQFAEVDLADIGVPEAEAACDPVQELPADQNEHIAAPTPIGYDAAPPSFGDHRPNWAGFGRKFYEVGDRPEAAELVHNLEHGYNVLWYDETVADDADALAAVQGLAAKFSGSEVDPSRAFIAAPWTSEDGGTFPDGMNYALTHWYADPEDTTGSREDEIGYKRYCGELSGEVVANWMAEYPQSDAPEGGPGFL
ncbi:MAG TPA: DUF3105 domain-containing protein [Nocardioidaceae bacterium]|nr:DUF3105 domain-containing protein [Nocardioidaceae bacterium]